MSSGNSFLAVDAALRRGSDEAANEVFGRFAEGLLALARRHLDRRLNARLDADDVLQSVMRSFLLRRRQGQFALENWDDLWSLLIVITVRKCGRQASFHFAQQRTPTRELVRLESAANVQPLSDVADERSPSPDEAIALVDWLEYLLGQLPPPDREVIVLRLQGYASQEIAERCSCTERTVRRVVVRFRDRCRDFMADRDVSVRSVPAVPR